MPEINEERLKELEEAAERAKALEAKTSRLEEESKKYKSRAQQAEEKISEAEKAKLEEQGELEKLLAKEREEKSLLSKKLESRTQGVLREKLRAEAARHAKDAHDIDMVLKVTEHKDLLSINEDELSVEGVEDFITKVRESKPYLFRKKSLDDTEDKKPKGDVLSDDEKYYAELDACTTRDELDKIKKKYGRL